MPKLIKISKKYGDKSIFDDFSLSIKEYSTTALLGKSGVGKTTLLNVIAGLTEYSGESSGFGKISYVFQEPRLIEHLTVYENIDRVLRSLIKDENERKERITEVLTVVKLLPLENRLAGELSGGEMQRVSLARAFAFPSDTVLLDEAFNSLDLALKISVMDDFSALNRRYGRTCIFVTHDVDDALYLADEIVLLEDNSAVFFGSVGKKSEDVYASVDERLRKRIYDRLLKGILER